MRMRRCNSSCRCATATWVRLCRLDWKGWLGAYRRIEIDAGRRVLLREHERIAASIERFVAEHRESCGNAQRARGRRVNNVG
jgi:hypothetical protein